jgi:hypothetical protein
MEEIRKIPEFSDEEKAFIWASIQVQIEEEKEQQAKMKAARKRR